MQSPDLGPVASEFVGNLAGTTTTAVDDPYRGLLAAYPARTEKGFAAAQAWAEAAAVVVEATATTSPKFRWQITEGAAAFVSLFLADLDGSRVIGANSTWLN